MNRPDTIAASLTAARDGAGDVLGELLETCRGYLLLVAKKELDPALKGKGGASDLVQETFLEAHRDLARFHGDSEAELLAWLRQLLLHNLADFTRRYRETAKRAVSREVSLNGHASAPGLGEALATDSSSPSAKAMARERTAELERVVEKLPDDYRTILLLHYQAERSFEEIAELMDRSVNAVRKLWARAVERVQQEMETDL